MTVVDPSSAPALSALRSFVVLPDPASDLSRATQPTAYSVKMLGPEKRAFEARRRALEARFGRRVCHPEVVRLMVGFVESRPGDFEAYAASWMAGL